MTTSQAFDFTIDLLGITRNIMMIFNWIVTIQVSKHPRITNNIPTLAVFNLLSKGKKRREEITL